MKIRRGRYAVTLQGILSLFSAIYFLSLSLLAMTQLVRAPSNLPDLVRTAFARARAAGDLTFFPTQVALLRVNGIPVRQLFCSCEHLFENMCI